MTDLIEGTEAGSRRRLNVAPNSPKSIFVGRVGIWNGTTPVLPSYCNEACVYVRVLHVHALIVRILCPLLLAERLALTTGVTRARQRQSFECAYTLCLRTSATPSVPWGT